MKAYFIFAISFVFVGLLQSIHIDQPFKRDKYHMINEDINPYTTTPEQTKEQFWEKLHDRIQHIPKRKYSAMDGDKVCFTCPIDDQKYQNLLESQKRAYNISSPPKVTIAWNTEFANGRTIFYCRGNTKLRKSSLILNNDVVIGGHSNRGSGEMEYECDDDRLCLINVRHFYPETYKCLIKSYVEEVHLSVIVELQSLMLDFKGESVKFDFQKEVQVHENQTLTIKCEVPETNPVSDVNAYIDNEKLMLTKLEKKSVDNRMTINTYYYDVVAKREMNGKTIKCEAKIKDLPPEFSNLIDVKSQMSKEYTLSVYYPPTCVYNERVYETGINRSIVIECPISGSNPDVTYYRVIPPSTRTKLEAINSDLDTLRRIGRYQIKPSSIADFGLYECIPRSLAGTSKCDIHVKLGATPNPPEHCKVQLTTVNNQTFAQFSCRPGFNQGGNQSFLTIYEQTLPGKELKLSGRVNIFESNIDEDVPYITQADENKYYEFVIMQENNYGNSTAILLTLGVSDEVKAVTFFESNSNYIIAGAVGALLVLICICSCCCCNDGCNSSKSDSLCGKCCSTDDMQDDNGSTYKKPTGESVVSQPSNKTFSAYDPVMNSGKVSLLNNYDNGSNNEDVVHYSRHHQFQKKQKTANLNRRNGAEEYDNEDDMLNDVDEKMIYTKANLYDPYHDEEEMDSDAIRGEDSLSSMSTSDRKSSKSSSLDDRASQDVYANTKTQHLVGNVYQSRNSLKKMMAVDYINENNNSRFGNRSATNVNGNNHYSTIDPKGMRKFIQTENGLVYTPLNSADMTLTSRNKSNDALLDNDDEDEKMPSSNFEATYDNKVTERRRQSSTELNVVGKKNVYTSQYGSIKKQSVAASLAINNNSTNSMLQSELALKLKEISTNKEIYSNGHVGSRHGSSDNSRSKAAPPTSNNYQTKPITLAQPEQFSSISTATTSVSSASSCASNSDLIIKNYSSNAQKRAAPIMANNENYSLFKATLNVNDTVNRSSNTNGVNGDVNGTNRNHNGTNGQHKPPILKPKPSKQQTSMMMNGNSGDTHPSNGHTDHSASNSKPGQQQSEHTSPSTSVTDVSSNNCTPQHGNDTNNDETDAQLYKQQQQLKQSRSRSNSNSLTRNGHRNFHQHQQHVLTNSTPVDYNTKQANSLTNGVSHYAATKLNGTMKTFHNGNVYQHHNHSEQANSTLGRSRQTKNKPVAATIDDEISMISSNQIYNPTTLKKNLNAQRTLERRHVKNSEC